MFDAANKRRRCLNGSECRNCEDYIDFDEELFCVCGECQSALCSDCVEFSGLCSVCDAELEEGGCGTEGPAMCEGCSDYCEECDLAFHNCCKADHLKVCNALSRAERAVASANQEIKDTEKTLIQKGAELKSLQTEISRLETSLESSKKDLKSAKKELAKEMKKPKGANDGSAPGNVSPH